MDEHNQQPRVKPSLRKSDQAGPDAASSFAEAIRNASGADWGQLDLSGKDIQLPAPGNYDGVVADVKVSDTVAAMWLAVEFTLDGHEATPAPLLGMIASRDKIADQHRLAEGARLINKLAAATGTPISALKTADDLTMFIGKRVSLTIAVKPRDGIAELRVRAVRPRT